MNQLTLPETRGILGPTISRMPVPLEPTQDAITQMGIHTCLDVGRILLDARKNPDAIRHSYKLDGTIQTDVDLLAEKRAREILAAAFPHQAVIGEEMESDKPMTYRRWAIDPIDSTHTYFQGGNRYAVSLAHFHGEEVEAGFVFNPETREMVYAIGDEPTRAIIFEPDFSAPQAALTLPLQQDHLDENGLLNLHLRRGTNHNEESLLRAAEAEGKIGKIITPYGSPAYALAEVAQDRFSYISSWQTPTMPWDVAAGVKILRNAGGDVESSGEYNHTGFTGLLIASLRPEVRRQIKNILGY